MALPSPQEVAFETSHPDQFSCSGLGTFTIAGVVIMSIALGLRMISRRMSGSKYTADDWTLLGAWALTVGAETVYLCNFYNGRLCYHTLTLTPANLVYLNKHWFAWGLLYTTGYPLARISLCLLYIRVFVKPWFTSICYALIFAFSGYSIGSFFADIFSTVPIQANWNPAIPVTHHINQRALFLANAGFNIATDMILLVLPLCVIWKLKKMGWVQKMGLSAVFCLGGLTVIASIFRLQAYLAWNNKDPNFILQDQAQWWTITELNLGILCPCLVAFGPLFRTTYLIFSSKLSSNTQDRLNAITGFSFDENHRPSPPQFAKWETKDSAGTNDLEGRLTRFESSRSGSQFTGNAEKRVGNVAMVEDVHVHGAVAAPAPPSKVGQFPAPPKSSSSRAKSSMAVDIEQGKFDIVPVGEDETTTSNEPEAGSFDHGLEGIEEWTGRAQQAPHKRSLSEEEKVMQRMVPAVTANASARARLEGEPPVARAI